MAIKPCQHIVRACFSHKFHPDQSTDKRVTWWNLMIALCLIGNESAKGYRHIIQDHASPKSVGSTAPDSRQWTNGHLVSFPIHEH